MAKSLDAWIHNFTVTDCETHKKGYTVYKITSIIFPVSVPESLTCLTVWKRYNEVKKLRKQIVRRHKELRLAAPGVPLLSDDGYFRRFDADVILARKKHILHFLDYIAKYPCLYKNHAFVQFFEASQSPALSPLKQQRRRNSNIASICGEIEVPLAGQDEYILIDPHRDEMLPVTGRRAAAGVCGVGSTGLSSSLASSSTISSDTTSVCSEAEDASLLSPKRLTDTPDVDVDVVDCALEVFDDGPDAAGDVLAVIEQPAIAVTVTAASTADYIFEAALEFSEAVRAEVARNYRQSFDLYTSGIGKLMRGVRADANAERRRVAKDKINKYMLRAEQIHACHLLGLETEPRIPSTAQTLQAERRMGALTRTVDRLVVFEELSRIKVLKVLNGVMQVQNEADQNIYIMKAIEKPANFSVKLFEHTRRVSGMVELINYFVSETTVYILLQQASGGRLWDYISSYQENDMLTHQSDNATLNSLFLEPKHPVATDSQHSDSDEIDDDAFLGTLQKLRTPRKPQPNLNQSLDETIENLELNAPSFDMLTPSMNVSDLLSCSQKLLDSVTSTIERSNADADASASINPVEQIFLSQDSKITKRSVEPRLFRIDHASIPVPPISTHRHVHSPKIPQRSIVRWASELCRTICDLHANGIQCGDLHADNMLLGSEGQMLLSYFHRAGAATISSAALDDLYVAPERPLTPKSDWWSFGVLLFELLTGERFVDCHPGGIAAYFEIQCPEVANTLSPDALDLLRGTLQRDVAVRLDGNGIRAHAFFRDIMWGDDDIGDGAQQ